MLCSPPASAYQGRSAWVQAIGGPLRPLSAELFRRTFPTSLSIAVHIRLFGAGEEELAIRILDPAGAPLRWGTHGESEARAPVANGVHGHFEYAVTVVLPDVVFPRPGEHTVRVQLTGAPADPSRVRSMDLPLRIAALASGPVGFDRVGLRTIDQVLSELGPACTPEARRVLRLAAAEARRLGHLFVESGHVLIALRRVLSRRSGLPDTRLLREAVERFWGLGPPLEARHRLRLTPGVVELLRAAHSASPERLDPDAILRRMLADARGLPRAVLSEAAPSGARSPQ